ncbi:allantoicase [Jatrophihabitans sp. YIM 134969]
MSEEPDFRLLPDLASRTLGGSVMWCNDESFADVHTLIDPRPAVHDATAFGPRGKVYDGWETRRRREPGEDAVIIRLAAPTLVHGIDVDTAFFRGNFPPRASVDTTVVLGYPDAPTLRAARWTRVVEHADLEGDTSNLLAVAGEPTLATHVRLVIHPDGGVARLRVHGEVVPDPTHLGGRIDLASTVHGGRILGCSNLFYSSPANVLAPGVAQVMSDGWETSRRRDDGNDWLTVSLGAPGSVRAVVVDTSRFVFNAPGWARVTDADSGAELVPRTALVPDTEQRFAVRHDDPVAAVRLDIYPDGGVSRFHVLGEVTASERPRLAARWLDLLPPDQRSRTEPGGFFT